VSSVRHAFRGQRREGGLKPPPFYTPLPIDRSGGSVFTVASSKPWVRHFLPKASHRFLLKYVVLAQVRSNIAVDSGVPGPHVYK